MSPQATALVRAWDRAARRALAADLPHMLRVTYHVRLAGERVGQCDCPAGLNRRPCAHRVAVAVRVYERRTGTRVVSLKPAAIVRLAAMLS